MTEYEAYQEHIRYTHDTYCRIVIRHASFDAARMLAARWKRDVAASWRAAYMRPLLWPPRSQPRNTRI